MIRWTGGVVPWSQSFPNEPIWLTGQMHVTHHVPNAQVLDDHVHSAGKATSLTQCLPRRASWTVRDFQMWGRTMFQWSGANWRMEQPFSQWSIQKRAMEPSPICTITRASKNSIDDLSTQKEYPDQVLSESARANIVVEQSPWAGGWGCQDHRIALGKPHWPKQHQPPCKCNQALSGF
jgi:hypothetical protein